MGFMNILIGTGILWLLNALVVVPLAQYMTIHTVKGRQISYMPGQELAQQSTTELQVSTGYYILADVLVLGISGLILGLALGWFFIGISLDGKNWPGMIAFIAASFAGTIIRGAG